MRLWIWLGAIGLGATVVVAVLLSSMVYGVETIGGALIVSVPSAIIALVCAAFLQSHIDSPAWKFVYVSIGAACILGLGAVLRSMGGEAKEMVVFMTVFSLAGYIIANAIVLVHFSRSGDGAVGVSDRKESQR